jgi:hypothetical protein
VHQTAVPPPPFDVVGIEPGFAGMAAGTVDGQRDGGSPHVLIRPRVVRRLDARVGERGPIEEDDLRCCRIGKTVEPFLPSELGERAVVEVRKVEAGGRDALR